MTTRVKNSNYLLYNPIQVPLHSTTLHMDRLTKEEGEKKTVNTSVSRIRFSSVKREVQRLTGVETHDGGDARNYQSGLQTNQA